MPRGDASPSGYVPLPLGAVLEDRTGQPTVASELASRESWLGLVQSKLQSAEVGAELRAQFWSAFAFSNASESITSYRVTLHITAMSAALLSSVAADSFILAATIPVRSQPVPPANLRLPEQGRVAESSVVTPAEELRRLTRLPPAMLARVFGISRTAFYKWIEGATPRDERFQHLVDVLTNVKAAKERLPVTIDFAAWLRTPVSPGAKTPLDFLRDRRFSGFRGLLLRATSADMGLTPMTSIFPARALNREQRALERERVSPSPRDVEDED